MPDVQLSPLRQPNLQLLSEEVVRKLDFKSRALYDLLVEHPESINSWECDMLHVEAFGEPGSCYLDRSCILDVINVGNFLDVSVLKFYCM